MAREGVSKKVKFLVEAKSRQAHWLLGYHYHQQAVSSCGPTAPESTALVKSRSDPHVGRPEYWGLGITIHGDPRRG